MKIREEIIARLEEADRLMRDNGSCDEWFHQCGDSLLPVVRGANGRLFELLLEATGYRDVDAAHLLRDGLSFSFFVPRGSVVSCVFRCRLVGISRAQRDRYSR